MYEGSMKAGTPYSNGKFYNEHYEIVWKIYLNERREKMCDIYDIESSFDGEQSVKECLTNKFEIKNYLSNFSFYNRVLYSL